MRVLLLIVLTCPIFALSSCASIVSGTNQPVTVDTPDCPGAMCRLTNSKGTWAVKTPGSVVVHRAYGALTVTCSRPGSPSSSTQVDSKTKGMAYGNIIFGGLIGAGVDTGTGAAYDYPTLINVSMTCGAETSSVGYQQQPSYGSSAPQPNTASALNVSSGNDNSSQQEIQELKAELDRKNRELEVVRSSQTTARAPVRQIGQFTGSFKEIPSQSTGVKRVSCEYDFGSAGKEWHAVYGGCPNVWDKQ